MIKYFDSIDSIWVDDDGQIDQLTMIKIMTLRDYENNFYTLFELIEKFLRQKERGTVRRYQISPIFSLWHFDLSKQHKLHFAITENKCFECTMKVWDHLIKTELVVKAYKQKE